MGHVGEAMWRLHPLIYTLIGFIQAQNVEKKKAESRTPLFLSLSQDILAWSQEEKCGVCNPDLTKE